MVKLAYKITPQDDGAIINTNVYFLPCRSWLNPANINNSLAHEQLHFDIAEYHRRLFLKRLTTASSSADIFPSAARAVFRDIAEQRRMMDADYDKQTSVGQNEEEQKRWNIKIAALLDDLEKYSSNVTTINLK